MIAVIADDFTGAAEIGGLGLRYGLNVRIETDVMEIEGVDLLIIATDTRSMDSERASQIVSDITAKLIPLNPRFIYKKTDSVMRGFILAELESMINVVGGSKVVLVSANPSMGRIITDKKYYINEIPLHKTGFANDPEFPTKSSNVLELLGSGDLITSIADFYGDNLSEGISVAEAKDEQDLKNWARELKHNFIQAGAGGYFRALLEQLGYEPKFENEITFNTNGKKCVYVCGSAIDSSRKTVERAKINGSFVSEMPEEIIYRIGDHNSNMQKWVQEIELGLRTNNIVIIAINRSLIREKGIANSLRNYTAEAVGLILSRQRIDELMIEGGATAYSIIQKCGFHEFDPIQELSHGVLRMKVIGKDDFHITLKPGSYQWPEVIWNF